MQDWLNAKQTAAFLGMTERWLTKRRLIRKPPPYHRFGGSVRYNRVELEKWIASTSMQFKPDT